MVRASNWMLEMENTWDPICCNAGKSGACFACNQGMLAFVTAYSYPNSDIKYSGTWVRTCPDFWKFTNAEKATAGFVLYHELVHVVSTVGDGYGGYSKSSGVQLAYDEPIKARLTANNYMLYAM
jgi:Zn-dependent peptidase ImmA (M78 family)